MKKTFFQTFISIALIAASQGADLESTQAGGVSADGNDGPDAQKKAWVHWKNLIVRSSLLDPDQVDDPARFGWTASKGGSPFYNIDMAVGWKEPIEDFGPVYPGNDSVTAYIDSPKFEAHISNETDANSDNLSARLPLEIHYIPKGKLAIRAADDPTLQAELRKRFFTQHTFQFAPVYETDRRGREQTISLEALYSPTIPKLYMGEEKALGPFLAYWRPFVGIEALQVLRDKLNEYNDANYVRFVAKATGYLILFERTELSLSAVHRTELNHEQRSLTYAEASLQHYLDKKGVFAVGVTGKTGKAAPKFENVKSVNLWLGIKY